MILNIVVQVFVLSVKLATALPTGWPSLVCTESDDNLPLLTSALESLYTDPNIFATQDFLPPSHLEMRFPQERSDRGVNSNECLTSTKGVKHVSQKHRRPADVATCPWRTVTSVDPSRLPVSVQEVECKCDRCVKEVTCPRTRQICTQFSGRCEPVYSSIPVIKRECNGTSGRYMYRAGLQRVSVGCTCIQNYHPDDTDHKIFPLPRHRP